MSPVCPVACFSVSVRKKPMATRFRPQFRRLSDGTGGILRSCLKSWHLSTKTFGAPTYELPVLQRKLNALGFASPEVINALLWLEDLQSATHHIGPPAQACSPGAAAKRVFTAAEQARLGRQGWGLLTFLMQIGALTRIAWNW